MPGRGDRGGKKEKPKDAKGTLLRILRYLADYRLIVVFLCLLALLSNAGNLIGPKLAGSAIAEAEAGAGLVQFDRVFFYAKWMLIVYVGSNILSFCVSLSMMWVAAMWRVKCETMSLTS